MAATGKLIGLSAAELAQVRDAALSCILAASVRGISYSIAGRAFTFPNLESAQDLMQEANFALLRLQGRTSSSVRANFNPALRP
jgi:hypothetical protein